MKHSIISLVGYTIKALDGEIGKVKEFFFDDETWTVRFLIVKTGNWLTGRKVCISPGELLTSDWEQEDFKVHLTLDQIKNSTETISENHFLHNTGNILGRTMNAVDGNIGKVVDLMVNDRNWKLDFMVVDTGNWYPGEKVIISPDRIKEIEWDSSGVTVNTMVELVKDSPEYYQNLPIGEVYEADLENHYNGFVCHKRHPFAGIA
ncbi:MAG: PRC-barrel domain containing protein [Bacteroidales bacterium]|nr:PRC-barrel domain containing protein [Bacteroidales bacterium]